MTTIQDRMRKNNPMLAMMKSVAAIALIAGAANGQTAPPAPPAAVAPGQPGTPPPTPPVDQPPAPRPPAPPAQAAVQLSGAIVGYNYGPKGNYESLLIKSGDKLSQINFPPDAAGVIANAAHVGDSVQISATPAMGLPDHGVYEFVSLTPANGQPITIAGPEAWHVQHVDAVVKNLNYGRHGEINGAVLDNGDFVHLGPDAAALINLAVGQKLGIDGYARPMLAGHDVIEADSVNGKLVRTTPPPPPGGPAAKGPRGPRPGDAPPTPGPAGAPPTPPAP